MTAHLTDQVRPALERENSARHEGGQQVGPDETLRLRQDPESRYGGGSGGSQRLDSVRPAGEPPS